MSDYAILFLIVFSVNLMPAFGPPTWAILVLYGLNTRMPTIPLVITGAAAAAVGRYLLAHLFRLLSTRLSGRSRRNLEAAREALERHKRSKILLLTLFALSPVPSAQLFEAAGLAGVRLLGFTAAFFAGRIVSYFIYASTAAHIRETSIGDAFRNQLYSPPGILVQVALIGSLVAMTRIDWAKWTAKRR